MRSQICSLLSLFFLLVGSFPAGADQRNGFDVSNATIPVAEIFGGGPPRDGIPSIDAPKFIRPADAKFMRDDDIVLSLTRDGSTRAYPCEFLSGTRS